MKKFEDAIKRILKKHISDVNLEIPPDSSLGDYAFPCFILAKTLKKNPVEIAKDLAGKIKVSGVVKEVKAVGPYINFFVDKTSVSSDVLSKIFKEKDDYGKQKNNKKKIVIEYPGPNTNKPLHLGHVRNMVLGYALGKILSFNGNKIIPVNINNDRGIHICKSMLAYMKWGKGDNPTKSKLKPDFFVGKYYVKFNEKLKDNPSLEQEAQELLKKWEKGDKEVIDLWKKMNKWAFDGFKETYKKFDIKFEKEYYESDSYKRGKEIILDGLKKGIFFDSNGAVVTKLKDGNEKVLLRANGTTVYITQDIYVANQRFLDFKFDKMIYVVATEQNYHFKVLFEVLSQLKYKFADKCYHFAYGMVNLTSGKMKSRLGTVVDADNIVNDMEALAMEETKKRHSDISAVELGKRSSKIAMAAIRFYLLKNDPVKDILFDPKESISFEGETGPYLLYTYARINSILRKSKKEVRNVDCSLLKEKEELELITLLNGFSSIVSEVGTKYNIHSLCRYLLDLAQGFNNFYHKYPVIKASDDLFKARLLMISCVKQVLKNGLSLLGIDVVEKM